MFGRRFHSISFAVLQRHGTAAPPVNVIDFSKAANSQYVPVIGA